MTPPRDRGVVEFAPAKINLFLDILRRRGDGFHDLATLFLKVDLADVLTLTPAGRRRGEGGPLVGSFTVAGPAHARPDEVPADERNLVWRALELARATAAGEGRARAIPRMRVHLVKNVPHGAGLGGGSSDAAAALRGVNRLAGLGWSDDELAGMAARLGSDCPVFVHPWKAAMGGGRGEVLRPVAVGRRVHLLLLLPDFAIATGPAYGALGPAHLGLRTDAAATESWLASAGDTVPPALHNSFQEALAPAHPGLAAMRADLMAHDAVVALLSGSGSATFGLFADPATRDRAAAALASRWTCLPATAG